MVKEDAACASFFLRSMPGINRVGAHSFMAGAYDEQKKEVINDEDFL